MAQECNFFALLGDEEGDDVSELIFRVKQEEKKKNFSMVKKVRKEMKEEKKMAHQIPTDMRAKLLVLPSHVRRSFVVFDKKKEREKAEAEAGRKTEEEAKAKGSVDCNGDSNTIVAADDKTGEQTVKYYNRNGRQSTTFNGGNYKYRRNNAGANGYQQSNGYFEGKYRRANGYQGSFKGSIGDQRYNWENNGVSNGDQLSDGGDPNGNVDDDGWQYVRRRRRGNRSSTYQEHLTNEQDGIEHESFEESKSSEKDSWKSVDGDNNGGMAENNDLAGEAAVKNEVQGLLPVTPEEQEDAQSEKMQLMTLEEYEKKKLEDRKSSEAFKRSEQWKVEDKDFESMQLIGKKKEDDQIVTKQFSFFYLRPKPKDKLKKKKNIKEEKVLKALSIDGFLKPAEVKTSWQRRTGDRPNGNDYGQRPNGRFAGERPNINRDGYGERPASIFRFFALLAWLPASADVLLDQP